MPARQFPPLGYISSPEKKNTHKILCIYFKFFSHKYIYYILNTIPPPCLHILLLVLLGSFPSTFKSHAHKEERERKRGNFIYKYNDLMFWERRGAKHDFTPGDQEPCLLLRGCHTVRPKAFLTFFVHHVFRKGNAQRS